jgi:3-hydroxyisobutyrate dehydrogenase-like beta-hydroxyacid dehydrogenase
MGTSEPELKVGVIGLGIMGGAFAGHLAAAGVPTLGFDVLEDKLEELAAQGGQSRSSARAVAAEADTVITSLPSVKALEAALFGKDGLIAGAHPGLVVAETSTLPLDIKEKARASLADAGIGMLDAPVSGTGPQARAKDILVLASGERADFERVRGALAHFARSVRYVGEFGAGSKVKYVANLLVAVHTLAAAEAMVLGEKAGLDRALLLDVLTDGAGTSRMLEVRGPSMVVDSYAAPMIKVDTFQKDLDIIAAFARHMGCPVPLFDASLPIFTSAGAQGMGGYDTAAVVAVLRRMAGLAA